MGKQPSTKKGLSTDWSIALHLQNDYYTIKSKIPMKKIHALKFFTFIYRSAIKYYVQLYTDLDSSIYNEIINRTFDMAYLN